MQPVIDHIHITVKDIKRAESFYDLLLPLLGFDLSAKEKSIEPASDYILIEYHHLNISLGIVSARTSLSGEEVNRRRPGALHHLAFRAAKPSEVDAIYSEVLKLPAVIVHPPKFYPEYCQDYYAFFFKDSEGTKYEIVSFERSDYF